MLRIKKIVYFITIVDVYMRLDNDIIKKLNPKLPNMTNTDKNVSKLSMYYHKLAFMPRANDFEKSHHNFWCDKI